MKSTKTKIFSLVMALAMLVSAFSMLGVSAEDADLKFSGATLSIDSDITVYFMVAEEALADYEDFYATFNVSGETTTTSSYFKHTYAGKNYYMIPCRDIAAKEMNDTITANIYGVTGGNETQGAELTYSVAKYCYNRLNSAESGENMKKLAANLLEYGAAAQTEFGYNTENLANANMTEAHKAYVTSVNADSLTSHYENTALDGASVAIDGATMELGNRISVVFELTGETDGTTAKLTWDGGEQTVTAANYKDISGKKYVYFDAIDPADYGKILTVTVYNGETAVSNTVKYSLETYAKNTNSAIALSVLGYCKSAETYIGGDKCLNGHTWTEAVSVDESYNVIDATCSACGLARQTGAKAIPFTSESAVSAHDYAETTTFNKGYDAMTNALKVELPSVAGDPYLVLNTKTAVDITEYSYIAVYAKSNAAFSIGYQGESNENLNCFDASAEWNAYVMNCSALTGSFGKARINFTEKSAGDTLYINSIAFFKTEEEARAFTGIDAKGTCTFGHTWSTVASAEETSHELSCSSTCDVCGAEKTFNGAVYTASQLSNINGGANATSSKYDSAMNAWAVTYTNYNTDPFYDKWDGVSGDIPTINLSNYNYAVVYAKGNCNFSVWLQETTQNPRATFTAGEDWKGVVLDITSYTVDFSFGRVAFPSTEAYGTNCTAYINSIAFFETAEEANAFAGIGLN